jgi:hypothetical protein
MISDADETVALSILSTGAAPGEMQDLRNALRDELLALPIDDVAPVAAAAAPAHAKGAEALAVGALVLQLGQQTGVFAGVVDVVASWLVRQRIDIAIDIDGQRLSGTVTKAQRDALVGAYLGRVQR